MIQKIGYLILLLALGGGCGQANREYYVKHVRFPEGASLEEKIDMAARLVPSPSQEAWQQLELTAFLHFGMNTFTDREWGDGKEDPAWFAPTGLDAEQWVRTLKESGFKMVILTAKHHDGFCLWPTKTTTHSVASSPWKNGKGDVVRELREACDKHGMKFGVYLSPWDRNAPCYGDSPRYNELFVEQLTELLTNYGEIHEVWFDGACAEGPNGKKQEYDWQTFYETIQRLQPRAVMAIMGDDVRWVGNERGLGRETEWSATVLTPGIYARAEAQNSALGINQQSQDLGSRDIIAKADELFWYPSEVDVSIRPGWFYHAEEDDRVKSLPELADIYFQSVGYNSALLLNVPPDRRGRIHENDSARLREFARYLQATFSRNHIARPDRAWDAKAGAAREYGTTDTLPVNVWMVQEDISRGQRVERFAVEAFVNGQWTKIGEGTTIGHKRLLRFPEIAAERFRLTILESRGTAHIKEVGAFHAPSTGTLTAEDSWSDIPVEELRISDGPQGTAAVIDGDRSSCWQGEGKTEIILDLQTECDITGFVYVPPIEAGTPGTVYRYDCLASRDGRTWTPCVEDGEFSNIMYNTAPRRVRFSRAQRGVRYLKFIPREDIQGNRHFTINELGVLL